MPTDYKSRNTSQQKKSLPGFVWLLSGLAIGLFVAFIIYLDKQPENESNFGDAVQQELNKLKQQANKPDLDRTTKSEDKKELKFNFYTILPELEVLIPESETRPPDVKKSGSSTGSNEDKQYLLQVGSFQNLNDAEKLKANLAFLGIKADVQNVTVNGQSWHRVRCGPYVSKQQLYKAQSMLKQNDIHSISIELK